MDNMELLKAVKEIMDSAHKEVIAEMKASQEERKAYREKNDGHIRSRLRRDEVLSRTDRGKCRRNGVRGSASGGP
jgi:hypothetical protein